MWWFTTKVTGDAAFLKINSFASIFEEVYPQFELAALIKAYCSAQVVFHNSGDYDF